MTYLYYVMKNRICNHFLICSRNMLNQAIDRHLIGKNGKNAIEEERKNIWLSGYIMQIIRPDVG